jgi:hypothetical protein
MMLVFGRRSRDWVLSGTFSCINNTDQTQSRTMTSQSPRIYIYKITFEEVLYYYYGVHKEKVFGEEYWGSPYTHKWVWNFYTPKKQILEVFEYSDEGWIEAQEVEKRLIKPFYNTDKWCLNENCGGKFSIQHQIRAGSIGGNKTKELEIGVFALTKDERLKYSSKGGITAGNNHKKNNTGICGIAPKQRSENGIKAGNKCKELGLGIHALTFEERSENAKMYGFNEETAKKYGEENVELKRGVFGMTDEELYHSRKRGGDKNRDDGIGMFKMSVEEKMKKNKKAGKSTSSQKWMCEETGYISTPGGLSSYQKKRGIDTSKRKRIE